MGPNSGCDWPGCGGTGLCLPLVFNVYISIGVHRLMELSLILIITNTRLRGPIPCRSPDLLPDSWSLCLWHPLSSKPEIRLGLPGLVQCSDTTEEQAFPHLSFLPNSYSRTGKHWALLVPVSETSITSTGIVGSTLGKQEDPGTTAEMSQRWKILYVVVKSKC